MPGMANMPNAQLLSEGNLHNGLMEGAWVDYLGKLFTRKYYLLYTGKKERGFCLPGSNSALEKMENYREGELEAQPHLCTSYRHHLEETYYSTGLKHAKHTKWYANRNRCKSRAIM